MSFNAEHLKVLAMLYKLINNSLTQLFIEFGKKELYRLESGGWFVKLGDDRECFACDCGRVLGVSYLKFFDRLVLDLLGDLVAKGRWSPLEAATTHFLAIDRNRGVKEFGILFFHLKLR